MWRNLLVMSYSCRLTSRNSGMTLTGTIGDVIGCKNASCFAIILASQAVGVSRIHNVPKCAEISNLIIALKALGIRIYYEGGCIVVEGAGVGGFAIPGVGINAGNSTFVAGSLCGILATHPFASFVLKKESSSGNRESHEIDRWDIKESLSALQLIGAKFIKDDGTFPILVTGIEDGIPLLTENILESETAKAATLLASANVAGESCIRARRFLPTYMELLLQHFGADIEHKEASYGAAAIYSTLIVGQTELLARDVRVFPSMSYVLYLIAAVLVTRDSEVAIEGVLIDERMRAIIDIFVRMGGRISIYPAENSVLSTIKVKSSRLSGVSISSEEVQIFWEELAIVVVVCVLAEGRTELFDVLSLKRGRRVLESVLKALNNCGLKCSIEGNTIEFYGIGDSKIIENPAMNVVDDYKVGIPFLILHLVSCSSVRFKGRGKKWVLYFVDILNRLLDGRSVISEVIAG